MIGMQYNSNNSLQGVEVARFGSSISSLLPPADAANKFKKNVSFPASNEPVSVLDTRSPSPSTSTSASGAGGRKEECVEEELRPVPFVVPSEAENFDLGMEDWECLLSESAGGGSDQYLLRWISGDVEDPSLSLKQLLQGGNTSEISTISDSNNANNSQAPNVNYPPSNLATLASAFSVQEQQIEPNPLNFNPHGIPNAFSSPMYGIQQEEPPLKRQNSGAFVSNSGSWLPDGLFSVNPSSGLLLRKQLELSQMQQAQIGSDHPMFQSEQKQDVFDSVYKAAELILTGQFSHAQMILARLNHQLSPMANTPLQRAAFYFKEALHLPLTMPISATTLPPRIPTPIDGVFKIGAYKAFSEVSPLIEFINFTSNQAILEAIDDAECIHIFDFDIAFGAQWSSFMLELPRRNGRAPSLKITAFASPSTHHPIEIKLMYENLTQFANEVGVKFELEVVNLDSFDPNSYPISSFRSSESEAIAVNFPLWSVSSHRATLPLLLHYIKQLSPKIVVSLERVYERTELPFPNQLINGLKYFEVLFESIDAANVTSDVSNKIERFLFQPNIESIVFGHLCFPDQMPPWRNLFASAGFLPLSFSNFAETQAECVAKRAQIRGFHVEKCQASLSLCWQNRELLSAMTWRC